MRTLHVDVYRDGDWWMIRVPEIDGLTQAHIREEIPAISREYIAVTLDVPAHSFELEIATAS